MTNQKVTIFKPYPLQVGQKIRFEGSRRNGDWEVVSISEHKITLQCPISNKEYTWDRLCYFAEEKDNASWSME